METLTDDVRRAGARTSRPLLLVDDDDLELCLMADRLGAAGYDVTTAQNGEQAKAMLATGAFPVVITDRQMPVKDGLQFVKEARSESTDRTVNQSYFIMWSVRAEEIDRDVGFENGVDDYVSKHSSDEELLARIEAGFNTVALRRSLLLSRTAHRRSGWADEGGDQDAWKAAASRLHAEILRASRYQRPLTVMMLHVERSLNQPHQRGLATAHLACLLGAIHNTIRHNIDWVMPLEGARGLARVMAVFPETGRGHVPRIRHRLSDVLADVAIMDEFAELNAECSVGLATVETWSETVPVNAASLVAIAEQRLERLIQPEVVTLEL